METKRHAAAAEHASTGKRRSMGSAKLDSMDPDILCIIFSFRDLFDLARCTVVCKFWNAIIRKLKLFEALCLKLQQDESAFSSSSTAIDIESLALKQHRRSLMRGLIDVDQWKVHFGRISQCRMKMGSLLTGVGDKVMRIWSLDSYKCLEEYYVPDTGELVDFDFDENKIVGLMASQLCIWRRNGQRSVFPPRGTFGRGLCMRYSDPEAVVGCEDGTACVFDMYSRTCSRIIRMQAGPVTCLSLSEDQLILCGSSIGTVTVSDPLSDQQVVTLKALNSTGGIKTICYNPISHQAFAGTTAGYVSCWDLRRMGRLWERRVSTNVVYSLQHLRNDTGVLAAGGIDGVLRLLKQDTGDVVSFGVLVDNPKATLPPGDSPGIVDRKRGRRIADDAQIHQIFQSCRPPITCLAVGMKKIVTCHDDKYICLWKFKDL